MREIILKTKEELGDAIKNAVSIGANNQPKNSVYIGSCTDEYDTWHYYQDEDGTFYYEGERILEFDCEMKEAQRRRKALRRMKNKQLA